MVKVVVGGGYAEATHAERKLLSEPMPWRGPNQ